MNKAIHRRGSDMQEYRRRQGSWQENKEKRIGSFRDVSRNLEGYGPENTPFLFSFIFLPSPLCPPVLLPLLCVTSSPIYCFSSSSFPLSMLNTYITTWLTHTHYWFFHFSSFIVLYSRMPTESQNIAIIPNKFKIT